MDSGNDACVALADYIAGGQRQFVEMMNNYAEKLHLRIRILKQCMVWMHLPA